MDKKRIKIAPSILSADFSNLKDEIQNLENAGADMIHIDVMDGHFVPNLTFGPVVIEHLRRHTNLPFDVHLMINHPDCYLENYANAGADIITIHPETTNHLHRTIDKIKKLNKKAGVALLPTSSASILEYITDDIDLVLIMTVNPGFGGQKFIHSQLEKIDNISKMLSNKAVSIAVDGGIDEETSKLCTARGADTLISGSYIFNGDYKERINQLRRYSKNSWIGRIF